jgi:imidazolonepropionase-like amidohydrolase
MSRVVAGTSERLLTVRLPRWQDAVRLPEETSMKAATALLGFLVIPALLAIRQPPVPRPLAFTHVTVIDGTGAAPRRDQTVVITGDRIAALGRGGRLKPPVDAQTIDAAGRFLIPGLWDMHVHIAWKFDLPLFVANGVTGVRTMDGDPEYRLWRNEVEVGALVGPRMVIASSIFDGPQSYFDDHLKIGSPEEAREAVRKARREGAEFIKIHDLLPRDAYFATIDEARKQGLPVAGHVPASVTPEEASDAGQISIEHLTRMDDLSLDTEGRGRTAALFTRFKKNRTWQCPTLVMTRNYASLRDPSITNDPRVKYVSPGRKEFFRKVKDAGLSTQEEAARQRIYHKKQAIVSKMQQAGVGILAGTDLANPYLFPGFSLHDELAILVEAGLKPMQALQAATRNPARFLGREKLLGTVQQGKLADLVLLDGDPLADIHNTTRIRAVVANGRFYDRATLNQILAAAEAAAAGAK